MTTIDRRRFFWLTSATAMGSAGAIGQGRAGRSCAAELSPGWPKLGDLEGASRTAWAFGTQVTMTAFHHDRDRAEAALDAALDELRLVEQLMSIYRPQSQLSRLNRDRILYGPHPYFADVLRRAEAISRRSGGAFDVTVQPLWALYAEATQDGRLPEAAAIRRATRCVDWRRVEISASCLRLRGTGTAITLNGIAQGFAADKAAAALRWHGVQHALINTGEISTLGGKPGGQPWTVGIQHPRREDAYIWLAKLAGRCLATSGDYATSFTADYRCNHLFDPRTGRSPERLASVSIAAPTATQADALSTAVFVLGPERGIQLVRQTRNTDALLVFKDGRILATERFPTRR